jgi:hypothetical protein
MRSDSFYHFVLLAGLAATALAGCANGAGSNPINTNPLSAPPAAGGSFVASSSPQGVPLPSVLGYAGTLDVVGATDGVGSTVSVTASVVPPSVDPQLVVLQSPSVPNPPIPLIYIGLQPSATISMSALPSFTIQLPPDVPVKGTFSIGLFDPANPSAGYALGVEGPAVPAGQTLTFVAPTEPVTFRMQQPYAFALYETPSPAPSP